MTAFELLKNTFDEMMIINPSDKIIKLYKDIMRSFESFEFIDSFYQIKKNDKGDGLSWEIMFFDKKEIIDIVVSRSSIISTTLLTKNILSVNLQMNYAQTVDEKIEPMNLDAMLLSLIASTENSSLYYATDTSKLKDFLRLRTNLLYIIPQ
jgi:hypothetical protein